jgi:hypothetical protein
MLLVSVTSERILSSGKAGKEDCQFDSPVQFPSQSHKVFPWPIVFIFHCGYGQDREFSMAININIQIKSGN